MVPDLLLGASLLLGSLQPAELQELPKIRHFVTLLMENRAADHVFGCFGLPGFDGIPPGGRVLYADASNKSAGSVNVTCGSAPYSCSTNPETHKAAKYPHYDIFAGKFAPPPMNSSTLPPYPPDPGQPYPWGPGGRYPLPDRTCETPEGPCGACTYPYAPQSDTQNSFRRGAAGVDIMCYGREQLPVKSTIARSFGVFNRYFTSVPSGSMPNHMFLQSGTSCGATNNEIYTRVGGQTVSYPQDTIFDHMNETLGAESFAFYMNNTGARKWPCTDANCSGLFDMDMNVPDVIMEGVARHKKRFLPHTEFYERAANGTLPQYSYILPSNPMSDRAFPRHPGSHVAIWHDPCYDMGGGERLLKDIYEALRAGPGWNSTLLWVGYDDAGGFYDHVVPPFEGVPSPEHPCHIAPVCQPVPPTGWKGPPPCLRPPCTNGSGTTNYSLKAKFDFRRLGMRSAAMLISPYVVAGSVFGAPRAGPSKSSQFEHSSIPATIKSLFGLPQILTKRTEWAAPFTELLTLSEPRTDAPMHLPEAPSSGRPSPPPPPAGPPWCGNGTADLRCRVFLRGNLCNDSTSSDFGGGSAAYRTVQTCMDWCVKTPGCNFFALSPSARAPWCIRYTNCTARTNSQGDATYTVYELLPGAVATALASGGTSALNLRRQLGVAAKTQHCGRTEHLCAAAMGLPSSKQRNQIPILSALTLTPEPDVDSMSREEAESWVWARWAEWLQ